MSIPGRIAFAGRACAGKDTLADVLERVRPDVYRTAFADPMKRELAESLGISLEELERNKGGYRTALQELGERGRTEDNRWIELMKARIDYMQTQTDNAGAPLFRFYCVTDVRRQDEVDTLRELGFQVVRLVAPAHVLKSRYYNRYGRAMKANEWYDVSEREVEELDVDEEWDTYRISPNDHIRKWLGQVALEYFKLIFAPAPLGNLTES